jgi:hypothetical protein
MLLLSPNLLVDSKNEELKKGSLGAIGDGLDFSSASSP